MRTAELIDQLGGSVWRVRPQAAAKRLCLAIAMGGVAAVLVLSAWLGVRPDLLAAMGTMSFWMKWMYTLSLTAAAFGIVRRLASPEGPVGRGFWLLMAPVALVGFMSAAELAGETLSAWRPLLVGATAWQCLLAVVGLSGPVFIASLWAFRHLAPTRLRLTGFAVGLLSGAVGATVYVLTCPEQSPAFMFVWYNAGMLSVGVFGALLGPRLLRW